MSNTLLPIVSRLPRPTSVPALLTAPSLIRELHWSRCRTEEPGYATGNPPEDYPWQSARRLWTDSWRLQLPLDDRCRLVLPHHAVKQATDGTDHCDPPRMGAKSTRLLLAIIISVPHVKSYNLEKYGENPQKFEKQFKTPLTSVHAPHSYNV